MIVYVDIDETICTPSVDLDYSKASPIEENIKKINKMYDNGDEIIYWTARGTVTGVDWREVTEKQFKEWGVKYHDLKFGKPAYDLFIDDKNINSETFFKGENMKLSNQAMGAVMMALQKSLLEQTDIVPILQSFEFTKSPETKKWGSKNGELVVKNPPSFKIEEQEFKTESKRTVGSD